MNILVPDSWLREYLITDATPSQIKEYLSLCGPTIDRITRVGSDYTYDIEITSNRVDMASVYGIAREAAAILPRFGIKAILKNIPHYNFPSSNSILPLTVTDPSHLTYRLLAIVMDNIKLAPSPDNIKEKLEKSGIRSLNNAIDITNYVMLELGHPCHVFDYDRIKTGKLLLRKAKKGEKVTTLDSKEYILNETDVVIDDATGRIIDLPGIMGTANSVVTNQTKRVIIFIESNNPLNIRKTSMRLGLRTLAATINEKHPDPKLAKITFDRAVQLFKDLTKANIGGKYLDIYPNPIKPISIKTTVEFINNRLGVLLKGEQMKNILESLGFQVTLSSFLTVTPPTFRQFDVTIPEDIVEEVARIYGYHNLPSAIMEGSIPISLKPKDLPIEEKIKIMLKYWGYTETYHYSFISHDLIKKSGLKIEDHLKVANPLTPDTQYMRTNLISSMLTSIVKNQHLSNHLQLFELSKVYHPRKNDLPHEISMLTITSQTDFWHLKGIVESLLKELGITNVIPDPIGNPQEILNQVEEDLIHFFHPLQTLELKKEGNTLATIGKLHPSLSNSFDIKKDTCLAYLNVANLVKFYNPLKKFTPLPQFPPIIEDLSFDLPSKTYLGPIIFAIYTINPLVKNVEMVDKFKDTITLRLTFQSEEKNLTNEEIQEVKTKLSQILKSKFKASIKSKIY